mmetsp:Transcript_73438/g.212703  ORF Transcript_73438/g.212703 Transcript_73438/m.212703 type:complete len:232 (+) Transcript_73438:1333-2028(+)
MLATFCGGNSQHRLTKMSARWLNSGRLGSPTVAKAHTTFDNSCGLNATKMCSRQAASANARNNDASWRRTRAKAHAVFAMPCVAIIGAADANSRAKLEKSAWLCTFAVPKAHAIVARHCGLKLPCGRFKRCGATAPKKSSPPMDSFAKDQSKLDSSKGFISCKRPREPTATLLKNDSSRNRIVAQDQQIMLKQRISLERSSVLRCLVQTPVGEMLVVMLSTSARFKLHMHG